MKTTLATLIILGAALMALTACTNPQTDLKSPCVGAKGSPCVWRPVNVG